MNRHFWAALLLLLASLPTHAADRLNVLILFADDQRADTIAALGNPNIKTPNLDRLVRDGVSFRRAYMQGGLQGATCVPSRAMLLSGKSLFRIDEKLQRDETWPAAFGKAGYTTFMTGKWHNGPPSIPLSFQQARAILPQGMTNPMKAKLSDMENGKLTEAKLAPKHACEMFADEAVRFLQDKHDQPFFCYVPFDAPHDPHIVPPDFAIQYDPAKIPLPANYLPKHPFDEGEMAGRDERLLPWPRTPEAVRQMLADYYRYISYLDSLVGRVLDALEASPYAKNTIVVFAADSGVSRGSHGLIGKQNLYDESVHVPLILKGPGIAPGQTTDAMCFLFDVLPTLGKLCSVTAPPASEGQDLSAVLADPTKAARPHLFFAYRHLQRAIRDERWKLIRYPLINRTQLFDLVADPGEINSLADQPEQAERVASLLALLEKEAAEFGDKTPLTVPNPKSGEWTPPPWTPPTIPGEEPEAKPAPKAGAGATPIQRKTMELEGWKVAVNEVLFEKDHAAADRALELLKAQLAEIVRVVPKAAVAELQKVPLWISPEYAGIQPRAEYHPDAGWLRAHDRDPVMAKGVEFTNVRIFEAETHRMPMFALHELAHSYHDRVLGFDDPRIEAAYEKAKASGKYDRVQRRDAKGRITTDRAYALTNAKEYFAECTEAFFGQNDFYPFTREELKTQDPDMFALLETVWNQPAKAAQK